MSVSAVFRVVLTLLCVFPTLVVITANAATVTTQPELPLLDVGFCATPSADLATATLFISLRSDCSTTLVSSELACGTTGALFFNVTSAAMGIDLTIPVLSVRPVYWCQRSSTGSSAASPVGTLKMNVVVTSPPIYPRGQRSTLTFNEATPVGAIIQFGLSDGECPTTLTEPGSFTLDAYRAVEVTLTDLVTGVCAWIPSSSSGGFVSYMTLRNRLRGYTPTSVSPSSGASGSNVVVTAGQANIFYTALSESPTCSDLPTPTRVQVNSDGDTFLEITKPRGSYYFCMAEGDRVYYPATNKFAVVEYGVQPNTAYAGYPAKVYPSKNTSSDMEVALFGTQDCGATPVQSWTSLTDAAWDVTSAGTYYACVRPYGSTWSSTYVLANSVTVVVPPAVMTMPTAPMKSTTVQGRLSFSVASVTPYRVGLSDSTTCTPFYRASVDVGDAPVVFSLGSDAPDTVYWCVSIPSFAATASSEATSGLSYAPVHAMKARGYELNHGPLFPGVPTTFTMSNEMDLPALPSFAFVRVSQGSCSGLHSVPDAARSVVMAGVPVDRTLSDVVLPVAGEWYLCVSYDELNYSGYGMSRVQVYGGAVVSPSSIVARMTTTVSVSSVEPGQVVTVTDSADCSRITRTLGAGVADTNGVAAVAVTYDAVGTVFICGSYTGLQDGATTTPVLRHAANLTIATPRVFPAVMQLASGSQTMRVVAGGAGALVNKRVILTSVDSSCTPSSAKLTLPPFATVLPPLQRSNYADTTTTPLTLNANMVDTRYRACVETNGTYVDAGTFVVTRESLTQSDATGAVRSTPVVAGQQTVLTFPSSFTRIALVDTYVVVEGTANCSSDLGSTHIYATGSIDPSSGVATGFVAPSPPTTASGAPLSLRVCVAPQQQLLNSTYGYIDGGALTSYPFTAVSAYAQRSLDGGVVGWPVANGATLYLVSCAGSSCDASAASETCQSASTQYPVSARTATSQRPSSGTHLLCQRVTEGSQTTVVGSTTTVTVVSTFAMTSTSDLNQLRTSVDFDATVTGGESDTVQVIVQPLDVPCGTAAAESQTFTFTIGVQRTLSISTITAYQPLHFCAQPSSNYRDAFEVATGQLYSYSSPSYIAFPSLLVSSSVTVTLPTTVGLQGMLSSTVACSDTIAGGELTLASNGAFTFTISPCGANSKLNVVHFCELPGGIATYRGSLLLLRQSSCVAGDTSAAIRSVVVAPGTPITNFGVNEKFLVVAGLSKQVDCLSVIATSVLADVGYMPSPAEDATFFVCTHPVGAPAVSFTSRTATLTVQGYTVRPSVVRSPANVVRSGVVSTLLTLSSPLPSGYTFFSSGTACTINIGDAPGLTTAAASAVYSTPGQCGAVSICWQRTATSVPLAVAQFTSLTTPDVQQSSLAVVRGAAFSASLVSGGCSAAAGTGGGGETPTSVYLSADNCVSVLTGTTTGGSSSALRFTTAISADLPAGVSTASLCATTSAGAAPVIAGVPVAQGEVYPTSVTSGSRDGRFFIPRYPNARFWLAASADGCSASEAVPTATTLPSFTTDASGYGTVNGFSSSGTGAPIPVGAYSLCFTSSSSLSLRSATTLAAAAKASSLLDTIEVVPPSFFDVRGTTFAIGVTSTMRLLGDLTAGDLLDGFSPARDCSGLSTTYGTWSRLSATTIAVTARRSSPSSPDGGVFLCARVPLNLSVVSVPGEWSSASQQRIVFADAVVPVPPTGFDACTTYAVSPCAAATAESLRASPSTQLTVVYGDCCNQSNQASAVGTGSMSGGGSGTCSLRFDAARVRSYPVDTVFSFCAWDPQDPSMCATLNRATVNAECTDTAGGSKRKGLSGGAVAGVVIGCILGGAALVAAVLYVMWCLGYWGSRKGKRSGPRDEDRWSFGLDEGLISLQNFINENAPPEGNNCRRQEPDFHPHYPSSGRSTSPSEMRRDVLAQMAAEREDRDEIDSLDSWQEPRDTNFMDGCVDLTEKYVDFLHGIPNADPEEVSDFPGTAFLRRTQKDREALFDKARERSKVGVAAASVAGDSSVSWSERVRRSDILYQMERRNPFAKTLYLFFEEHDTSRTAVEISEDTAFFNLRTLFKSHVAELGARREAAETAAAVSGDCGVFAHGDYPSALVRHSNGTSQALSAGTTPSQSAEKAWLYRHRNALEFPWVTNNFRTLVGYRKGDEQRYDYVDWSLPLIDLQAFHPLHRWWSPALPPVVRSAADEQDARFAFMRPTSVVPFVKRYFMLFKVEYTERVQIETQETVGLSGLRNMHLDILTRLDVALSETTTITAAATSTTASSPPHAARSDEVFTVPKGEANPLQREGAALRDKLTSMDSRGLSSDVCVEDLSSENASSEEGRRSLRRSAHHKVFILHKASPVVGH